jgi:hypothetical protein
MVGVNGDKSELDCNEQEYRDEEQFPKPSQPIACALALGRTAPVVVQLVLN